MKKLFYTTIFFYSALVSLGNAMEDNKDFEMHSDSRRGHTYIHMDSPIFNTKDVQSVEEKLKTLVEDLKKKKPKKAIYVELPFQQGEWMAVLNNAGFEYYSDWFTEGKDGTRQRKGQKWIISNDSSVPAKPSFTHTARICIIRESDKNILLVNGKSGMTFPGGMSDATEDPFKTGIREVWEEVGLQLDESKVFLAATLHRDPLKDEFGHKESGNTSFYYGYVSQKPMILKIQEDEVSKAKWMHWNEIIKDEKNEVAAHIRHIVKRLFNGFENEESYETKLKAFHQYYKEPYKSRGAKTWKEDISVVMPLMKALKS